MIVSNPRPRGRGKDRRRWRNIFPRCTVHRSSFSPYIPFLSFPFLSIAGCNAVRITICIALWYAFCITLCIRKVIAFRNTAFIFFLTPPGFCGLLSAAPVVQGFLFSFLVVGFYHEVVSFPMVKPWYIFWPTLQSDTDHPLPGIPCSTIQNNPPIDLLCTIEAKQRATSYASLAVFSKSRPHVNVYCVIF